MSDSRSFVRFRRAGLSVLLVGGFALVAPGIAADEPPAVPAEPADAPARLEDTGERYRSPISRSEYRVLRDPATREKQFVDAAGHRFRSAAELVAAESAEQTRLERVVAPKLRAKLLDVEPEDTVDVILRLQRQPASEASDAAAERHGPQIAAALRRLRTIAADVEARRAEAVRAGEPADDDSLLTTEEREEVAALRSEVNETRRTMRREVAQSARITADADQAGLVGWLDATPGARIVGRSYVLSTVSARLPAYEVERLVEERSDVARVELIGRRKPMLDVSRPLVGANAWWNGGYNGSSTTKVAIVDSGIDGTHAAFPSGIISNTGIFHSAAQSLDSAYADDSSDGDDFWGHGTAVAGVVASNDSTYTGVMPGGKLMNAKAAYIDSNGQAYYFDADLFDAGDWAADNGADVALMSLGALDTADGSGALALFSDALVADLGISVACAAGNYGYYSYYYGYYSYITSPGDAFNVITVGNFDDGGTSTTSDDQIDFYSSLGPTGDGRTKPDVAAPGVSISCPNYDWENTSSFISGTGTSVAAPHVAGGLGLLTDAAVGAYPESLKALLLTNVRNTSPAPSTPDNTWGFGAFEMTQAYTNRAAVAEGQFSSSGPGVLFFRAPSIAANGRVTLAWNRRVTSNNNSSPTSYFSLLDLDLLVYDESDGSYVNSSESGYESVEQVKLSSALTSPVVKILRYDSFPSGMTSQRFSVAVEASSALTAVDAPDLVCTLGTIPSPIAGGVEFTLTAEITNDGDLTALAPDVTLSLPTGYTLVSGQAQQTLSDMDGAESVDLSFTVRTPTTGSGTRSFALAATSDGYEETFANPAVTAGQLLDVDAPSSSVVLASGAAISRSLTVSAAFAASDAHSGLHATPMRWREAGGTWSAWAAIVSPLDITFATDGTKTIQAEFRDVVGNVSSSSDSIVVDTRPLAGTVDINASAAYTQVRDVTLVFDASDPAGVTNMRFSNDGVNWSTGVAYSASGQSWQLSPGDGTKTVHAQYQRTGETRWSYSATDTIVLDITAPEGFVAISNDAPATNTTDAQVNLTYRDTTSGVVQMRLSDDGVNFDPWQTATPSVMRAFLAGEGVRTVYAQFIDAAGNLSLVASDDILVDRTIPTGSFTLAGGTAYLPPGAPLVATVTTDDGAGGSGVDSFRWSHDDGQTWADWAPVTGATVTIDLPAAIADVSHTVVGEFRDRAGNVSAPSQDAIHVLTRTPQDATATKSVKGAFTAGGDFDVYEFELLAGDSFSAKTAIKPVVKKGDAKIDFDLYGPDGTLLVDGRFPAGGKKPGIAKFLVPATGAYRLVLRGSGADVGAGLSYSLATAIKPGKTASVFTGTATGTAVTIPFSGAEGRIVTGNFLGVTFADAVLAGPTTPAGASVALKSKPKGRFDLPSKLVLSQGTGDYELRVAGNGTTPIKWTIKVLAPKRAKSGVEL